MENLNNILESLLFVADEPLGIERLKKIIPEVDTRQIRQAMNTLASAYDDRNAGFYLDEVAGGYQLRTRPAYTEWIQRLVQPKPSRLSRAALETLAIIAYKQPVLRADIEHIRGVDSGGVLRLLMERKLIRILGRKEIPGRPLIYATTKLFLEVFGLKDLKELPTPEEIESLGADESDGIEPSESKETNQPHKSSDSPPLGDGGNHLMVENEPDVKHDAPQESAANNINPLAEKDLDAAESADYKNDQQPETGG